MRAVRASKFRIMHFVALKRWVNRQQQAWLDAWTCAKSLLRTCHARGLSQEELAYEAGINRSYISKIEKGTTYVGLEIIGKVAKVLKVEPAELLVRPPKRGRAR